MNRGGISVDSEVVASGRDVSAELESETVLLNLESGVYYGLNESGTETWNLLQEPIQVSELRDRLCEKFGMDQARCEEDLLAFLEGLLEEGLIEVRR